MHSLDFHLTTLVIHHGVKVFDNKNLVEEL